MGEGDELTYFDTSKTPSLTTKFENSTGPYSIELLNLQGTTHQLNLPFYSSTDHQSHHCGYWRPRHIVKYNIFQA